MSEGVEVLSLDEIAAPPPGHELRGHDMEVRPMSPHVHQPAPHLPPVVRRVYFCSCGCYLIHKRGAWQRVMSRDYFAQQRIRKWERRQQQLDILDSMRR